MNTANNHVCLVPIGSLMDGKNHFYIPCYQRGYRWNKKQIEDLLSDLYSFKKQYNPKKTSEVGDFYCLQPVVVREINDQEIRNLVLSDKANDDNNKLWEVIDGQQRLTSLYILISYLLKQKGIDNEGFIRRYRAQLYTLFYEARPETKVVLESLTSCENCIFIDNIDAKHITNAFGFIDKWFEGKGLEISKRYVGGNGEAPEVMWDNLLSLITANTDSGSIKIIWYQLGYDDSIDPIEEFTRINNGKIPLTDTELIKALLLQKRNFEGNKIIQQVQMSMQWEQIENSLQRNDFWCFISNKGIWEEDRMGELLKLVYLKYNKADIMEIESGDIFRFFYNKLDGLNPDELQNQIEPMWSDIVDTFRILEDWFNSPEIYNCVGYLVQQSDITLDILLNKYLNLRVTTPNSTIKDFVEELENLIRNDLPRNWMINDENGECEITVKYPDRKNLRKVLLLLNVDILSQQLKEIRKKTADNDQFKDVNSFKFPFDLYSSQKWDIEHIDSATVNDLSNIEAQEAWVTNALKDINDPQMINKEEIKKGIERKEWKDLIGIIQRHQEEDLENKDFIGNLTLLDFETNREYKNALFCQKRSEIIRQVRTGKYILPCTLYVFMKFFDDGIVTESRTKWTKRDQDNYHNYIVNQLKRFSKNQ